MYQAGSELRTVSGKARPTAPVLPAQESKGRPVPNTPTCYEKVTASHRGRALGLTPGDSLRRCFKSPKPNNKSLCVETSWSGFCWWQLALDRGSDWTLAIFPELISFLPCVLASLKSSPLEPRHVIPRPGTASDLLSLSRASWHISWFESGCYPCQSRQVPGPEQTKRVTVLSLCKLVLCDFRRGNKHTSLHQ